MTDEQKQELLYNYIGMVLKCEGLLMKNYNLESIPYLNKRSIPKSSKLLLDGVELEYNFHGSGCSFILGSIELDYDIYVDRENYIVISPWGFMLFINSFLKPVTNYTEEQIAEWLETLNSKGIINKIYQEYFVYEVSFTWYKAFKSGIR
jgi:hypothetical protein